MTEQLKKICSEIMHEASLKTLHNKRSNIKVNTSDIDANSDGVGTKIEIYERLGRFDLIGYDLVAMLCDDAIRTGNIPIFITDIIDANKLDPNIIKQFADGLVNAANDAGVFIHPDAGETAVLGNRVNGYGEYNMNIAGTVVSIKQSHKEMPKKIWKNDMIIALKEPGFRSNGFTPIRRIMEKQYGDEWKFYTNIAGREWQKQIALPSKIYTKFILSLIGDYGKLENANVKAVINVTGSGIPEKLKRVLEKQQLGAFLFDLNQPNEAMHILQYMGGIKDREAYETWCMGNGMLIITNDPQDIFDLAVESNIEAKVAGVITTDNKISIVSKGEFKEGILEWKIGNWTGPRYWAQYHLERFKKVS